MIENVFIKESVQRQLALEYIYDLFKDFGISEGKIVKTPVGDKVIVYALKPNLIVRNFNLYKISKELERKFKLEKPIIDIKNIKNHPDLDPEIVGQRICRALEVKGVKAFKMIGYQFLSRIMKAGAYGAEIRMNGKIPADRGASHRFVSGYLPKVGEIVQRQIKYANVKRTLKPGVVSIDVYIFPPEARLPDAITIKEEIMYEAKDENGNVIEKEEVKIDEIKEENNSQEQ